MKTVRVELPTHLRNLASLAEAEVQVEVEEPVTIASVLDAIEAGYPMLSGTIREHGTGKRRAFLRYFACGKDISLDPSDTPLPVEIADGKEPLLVVGAIAGGRRP